jgi:hypothetical protein
MKISELYGKVVVSSDKKRNGWVLGICCEGDKIMFLLCCDEGEREFFINVANIICIDDKIIFEDEQSKLKRTTILRLGKAGYSEGGKFLGYLKEVEGKNFTLTNAKLGTKKYPFSRLVFGDVIIVKGEKVENQLAKDMFISAICN